MGTGQSEQRQEEDGPGPRAEGGQEGGQFEELNKARFDEHCKNADTYISSIYLFH